MSLFRMNWMDYQNHRFMFNGVYFHLNKYLKQKLGLKREIMFILNIRRDVWVSTDDILEFIYADTDPDKWGEWQLSSLRVTICAIRKILPKGVRLLNQYGRGYMLTIQENDNV